MQNHDYQLQKKRAELGISWNTPKNPLVVSFPSCVWLWWQLQRICSTPKLCWSQVTWYIGLLNIWPAGSAFIETTTATTKRDPPPHIITGWFIRNSYTTDLRFFSLDALSEGTFYGKEGSSMFCVHKLKKKSLMEDLRGLKTIRGWAMLRKNTYVFQPKQKSFRVPGWWCVFVRLYKHIKDMQWFNVRSSPLLWSLTIYKALLPAKNAHKITWVFPKIVGLPPKSSIFNKGVPLFSPSILGETSLFFGSTPTWNPQFGEIWASETCIIQLIF